MAVEFLGPLVVERTCRDYKSAFRIRDPDGNKTPEDDFSRRAHQTDIPPLEHLLQLDVLEAPACWFVLRHGRSQVANLAETGESRDRNLPWFTRNNKLNRVKRQNNP